MRRPHHPQPCKGAIGFGYRAPSGLAGLCVSSNQRDAPGYCMSPLLGFHRFFGSALEEVVFMVEGKLQDRMAALQAEFVGDVGAVAVNRALADEEFVGDLFAGLILTDQL